MSKKSSSHKKDEKLLLKSTKEETIVPHLPTKILKSIYLRRKLTCLGTTKSWLTISTRCSNSKQPQYPQLAVLPDSSGCTWGGRHGGRVSTFNTSRSYCLSTPPPQYPENIFNVSLTFSCGLQLAPCSENTSSSLFVTNITDPAFVVACYSSTGGGGSKRRWITHESTTIDPYDDKNRLMKFTNVVMSANEKEFYALSSQGCLVAMENIEDQLTIKEKCGTRAVPTLNAKYFREYLFESRGEMFLVFLIYRKGSGGVADEIEVFRLDNADRRLDLVKVDRLGGRVLFLDKECCLWIDSEKIECKGDCIYFTGGLGGSVGWWMYDMESVSISTAWKKGTRGALGCFGECVIEPVLFAP